MAGAPGAQGAGTGPSCWRGSRSPGHRTRRGCWRRWTSTSASAARCWRAASASGPGRRGSGRDAEQPWGALLTELIRGATGEHLRAELDWIGFARQRIATFAAKA